MPVARESKELYRDQQSTVSPSWLIDGETRYAVRTLTKLEFHKINRPKLRAFVMLVLGGLLTLISFRYIVIGAQPFIIPYIMLAGSLTLMVGSACALFWARASFRIDMTLLDGSCVSLYRKKQVNAEALLEGLSAAMDWHRNPEPLLPPLSQSRRLKKGHARSTDKQANTPTELPAQKPAAQESVAKSAVAPKRIVSPVVSMEHVRMKERITPFLALLSRVRNRRSAD